MSIVDRSAKLLILMNNSTKKVLIMKWHLVQELTTRNELHFRKYSKYGSEFTTIPEEI